MIDTNRLTLIPLTGSQLELSLNSIPALAGDLNIPLVSTLAEGTAERAISMKLAKMQTTPSSMHLWLTYWLIIIKSENIGVGLVGFKGSPDAGGQVEIGYGIDPVFQKKGYMTEAVCALVDWAFDHPECLAVTAMGVRLDNYASQKVLVRNKFTETGGDSKGINFIRRRT